MQEINWFSELFYSTEIWGWFGPVGLVVIGLLIPKKDKSLGIIFILLESLVIAHYTTLLDATPWYIWNIFILLLGVITCILRMASR